MEKIRRQPPGIGPPAAPPISQDPSLDEARNNSCTCKRIRAERGHQKQAAAKSASLAYHEWLRHPQLRTNFKLLRGDVSMRVTEDKDVSLGGGLTKQCHDTHGPRIYVLCRSYIQPHL